MPFPRLESMNVLSPVNAPPGQIGLWRGGFGEFLKGREEQVGNGYQTLYCIDCLLRFAITVTQVERVQAPTFIYSFFRCSH